MVYADPQAKREYDRAWLAKRRRDWFDANGPCRSCGSADNLELDHIDPTTKVSHMIWSWPDDKRKTELLKCQALCKKCHLEKTVRYRREQVKHGSHRQYTLGCRCDLCREGKKLYMREYRKR